jgi:mannan endo-1,4-beta-mannosidase
MKNQGRRRRGGPGLIVTIGTAIVAAAAIAVVVTLHNRSADPGRPLPVSLPPVTGGYLGVYAKGVPTSYNRVTAFTSATGTSPDVIMYYSGWYVPFKAALAETAAKDGAAPLIQMDPDGISVAAIASGQYDGYLSSYAEAVRAYGHPVILSFGHEMNGNWYSWGYTKTSPAAFVAAWRHIVTLFRDLGAKNVTWLWTVNIVDDTRTGGKIPSPQPWWPGKSYVTWVGIDGYYLKPNWKFAPLFGPTIGDVRKFTYAPILIAETGAVASANQPAKVADLFQGIRTYGLLGFVWFNATNSIGQDFSIDGSAALAAFRNGASKYYTRPAS